MHYKNGRKAEVGDPVIGMTYNRPGVQVGIIKSITPDQKTCNCTIDLPMFGILSLVLPTLRMTKTTWRR